MVKMRLLTSLLALFLFLLVTNPCVGASGGEMVVVFKGGQTEVSLKEDNGAITKLKPLAFRIPVFVGGIVNNKEFLMILCDVRYNGYLDRSFIEPALKTSYGDYKTWSDADFVFKNTRESEIYSVKGDLSAVMKGNKIYVLASSCEKSHTGWIYDECNTGWDPLMFVGTVMNRTESEDDGVYVKWEKGKSLKRLLPNDLLGPYGFHFINGVGNGVVTKNGAIIFPILIYDQSINCVASIIYSTDDGSTWHMGKSTDSDRSDGNATEWGDGKLLLSVRYDRGLRLIYESDDMGTTWKDSTMFSGVWGNQRDRDRFRSQGSLITVPVDGKDVFLFSHALDKKGSYKRDTLQLWMSDGQRIKCVGTISEDGKGERSGYSILAHVGQNLYIVHEINPYEAENNDNAALEEWDRVIAFSPLQDLFDSVKNTVRAWRQVDAELKNIHVPTNGLVGLLGDSKNNVEWEDKYNCVNANVNGATRVEGGFRFDGTPGSGAQWPVESQGQNQVYIFTKIVFTLAATVKVHSTKETGDHLFLGASMDAPGTRVLVGLGYTKDNKWYVVDGNGMKKTTEVSFELEKEYNLAITFNEDIAVYVGGVSIMNVETTNYRYSPINHFFMGGIGKSSTTKGCLCTVKNVMLFNRDIFQPQETEIQKVEKDGKQKDPTSSTKPQQKSDAGRNGIPNEDRNDKTDKSGSTDDTISTENPTSDNKSSNRYHKKVHIRADGAVGLISFTAWMCHVYSVIVLAGL